MPFGHLVYIQKNFFRGSHRFFFSAVDGIFLAFFIACEIPVSIAFVGHRFIFLFDAPNNFVKDFFLQAFGVFGFRMNRKSPTLCALLLALATPALSQTKSPDVSKLDPAMGTNKKAAAAPQ